MIVNKINFMPKFCSANNTNMRQVSADETGEQEFDLADHPYIDTFERESCCNLTTGFCDEPDEFETFEDYGGLSDAYTI